MARDDRVTSDVDWIEMRPGDTGTVIAKLESVFSGSRMDPLPGVILRFSDWGTLVVQCGTVAGLQSAKIVNKTVNMRVRRTEDGLEAIAIWEPGGVPIPLAEGANHG